MIDIICREYEKGEDTGDICKIAVLKYYSQREYNTQTRRTLKKFLQELCGKQIYFPFFLSYEKEWLIELQLWDKTLIEYKGQKGSRVMLYYQLQKGGEEQAEYSTEVLTPMYENLYVKKFVLFADEKLKYYFKETIDGNSYRSDKETCVRTSEPASRKIRPPERYPDGERPEGKKEKNAGICAGRCSGSAYVRTGIRRLSFTWDKAVSLVMR